MKIPRKSLVVMLVFNFCFLALKRIRNSTAVKEIVLRGLQCWLPDPEYTRHSFWRGSFYNNLK
jgi:hypothetical protein